MEGIFNFGEVTASSFDALPAGNYAAVISNLEFKSTKDNTGEYLSAEFTVSGQEFNGRKIFHMYNLMNKNPKAVEIAMQQMKSLLIETGCDENALGSITKQQLIDLLFNKQVGIKLKIQVDPTGQYDDKNVVVGYKMNTPAPVANNETGPVVF